MGKILITINTIKKEDIEFFLNEFVEIRKESIEIFSLAENEKLLKDEYDLSVNEKKYILKVRGEKSCYFYVKIDGTISNIIYVFRKSVIFNGNYIYTRIPLPNEEYRTFFSDKSFIKGNNVLARGDIFEIREEIDIERSYFIIDESGGKKKIIMHLYSLKGGLIEGDYMVKLSKKGG